VSVPAAPFREAPGRGVPWGAVVAWSGVPAVLAWLVVAGALVLPLGALLAVGVGAGAGAALCWAILRVAPSAVLRGLRARRAAPGEQPRVRNVAEGLCATLGLVVPTLYVVDASEPDAAAVGTRASAARLVVTSGLAEALSRVELEAVLAHELVHVRRGDVAPATVAAAVLGPAALVLPRRLLARLVRLARSEQSETVTDLAAVRVTRYPPALASALERLAPPPRRRWHAVDLLWTSEGPDAPSVRYRIDVLREL
jgi:Zn-dependent protease with chaperone function